MTNILNCIPKDLSNIILDYTCGDKSYWKTKFNDTISIINNHSKCEDCEICKLELIVLGTKGRIQLMNHHICPTCVCTIKNRLHKINMSYIYINDHI